MISSRMLANLPPEIQRRFEYSNAPVRNIAGMSVVIPIRGVDRQNNLNYTVTKLLQQNIDPLEIIISEEDVDSVINLTAFRFDSRIRHVFTRSDTTNFNKSKAINAGVAASVYPIIAMNDADIVLPKDYLYRMSIILCEHEAAFIAKEIYNMDFLRAGIIWKGSKRTDYFSGGSLAFQKSAFIKIGGMNEKFVAYGSEDCEFWDRVKALCKVHEERDMPLLHLNHKRKFSYSQNVELYTKTSAMPMKERVEELVKDLSKHFTNKQA